MSTPRGGTPGLPQASVFPCDQATKEKATEFARFVAGNYSGGVMTKDKAALLTQLANDVLACANQNTDFWTVDSATELVNEMKLKFSNVTATRLQVLRAEKTLLNARFCSDSLTNLIEQERIIESLIAAGTETALGYEASLRARLLLVRACSK